MSLRFNIFCHLNYRIVLLLAITVFCLLALPTIYINSQVKGDIFTAETAPRDNYQVAIVFGAAAFSDVFRDRLRTAADLYFLGKAKKILISGDNSSLSYNEPVAGQKFLMQIGVPEKVIALDYAGLRTLDTCARGKQIFSIESAYLVTQGFHLPRSLFLCRHFGIKVVGVNAALRPYLSDNKYRIREILAQISAFYEILLGLDEPKYGGDLVEL